MKKSFLILSAALFFFAAGVRSETAPLKLVQTIKLPDEIKGRFDHFAVDLSGNRVFATPEDNHAVLALDEANHCLFIACRSGDLIVFDTASGKELVGLPIAKGVDDLVFDKDSKRIYAAADGFVDVYQEETPDNFKFLAKVPSGPQGERRVWCRN